MSSGEVFNNDPIYEKSPNPEMAYLFETIDRRFSEAVKKQSRNKDVRYFAVDVVGGQAFYVFTLSESYDEMLKEQQPDTVQVLIPALGVDIDSPEVEALIDNPEAYFILRDPSDKISEHLTIIKPNKIEIMPVFELDNSGNEVVASVDENNYPLGLADVAPKERPITLALRIDRLELIPTRVPERIKPEDRLFFPPDTEY